MRDLNHDGLSDGFHGCTTWLPLSMYVVSISLSLQLSEYELRLRLANWLSCSFCHCQRSIVGKLTTSTLNRCWGITDTCGCGESAARSLRHAVMSSSSSAVLAAS
jgi:hypothetical protein